MLRLKLQQEKDAEIWEFGSVSRQSEAQRQKMSNCFRSTICGENRYLEIDSTQKGLWYDLLATSLVLIKPTDSQKQWKINLTSIK